MPKTEILVTIDPASETMCATFYSGKHGIWCDKYSTIDGYCSEFEATILEFRRCAACLAAERRAKGGNNA